MSAKTLTRAGKVGHAMAYEFLEGSVLARHILNEEVDICLTVGLSYRNPKINNVCMPWNEALDWIDESSGQYVYEACYTDDDALLHVNALSKSDLT